MQLVFRFSLSRLPYLSALQTHQKTLDTVSQPAYSHPSHSLSILTPLSHSLTMVNCHGPVALLFSDQGVARQVPDRTFSCARGELRGELAAVIVNGS